MEKEVYMDPKHGAKCRDDLKRYPEGILGFRKLWKLYVLETQDIANPNYGSHPDMFHMQNGTGLRNCTVRGLSTEH